MIDKIIEFSIKNKAFIWLMDTAFILLTALTNIFGFLLMAISTKVKFNTQMISGSFLAGLIIILGFFFTTNANAQIKKYTLEQAIERAKQYYPTIKSAELKIKQQKALKITAFDFGQTYIYTGKEELKANLPGIQTKIGIEQADIDLLGIRAKNAYNKALIKQAYTEKKLTEAMLERDVSIAWYNVMNAKLHLELYKTLDTLYANFEKNAKSSYKTQQISKIEYLTALAKYKELLLNRKKAENNFLVAIENLNQYLQDTTKFDINLVSLNENNFLIDSLSDTLTNSIFLEYLRNQVYLAKAQYKVQKANLYPKLSLKYKSQVIESEPGFYGWEVGISMPLIFFSEIGKNKAAKIEYEIAQTEFEENYLSLQVTLKEQINLYKTLKEYIDYYKKEALPLAQEQIRASNLAYKQGNIDYIQFIQNIEEAIETKQKFIDVQTEFLILSAQIKYLINQ